MVIKNNDPYTEASFDLKNRMLRFLWNAIYIIFFLPSPRSLHSWRVLLLRIFGAKIGKHCHIYPNVKIWAPWNIELGNYIGIADSVKLYSMDKIFINDYSVISDGSYLCCGSHDYNSKNFQLITKPITIKKKTWICSETFIHPGVTISEGCVIGARSVVTRNLDHEYKVYAGNPCKQVKNREIL
jgi:putative colanic acid biosynthesis acetyltransferase WcaF